MARRRFFAPSTSFSGAVVTLDDEQARHLREVLRLKRGDEAYVFDGTGKEFRCRIEDSWRNSAQLTILAEVAPLRPESPLRLTLALALLKSDKFDLAVQKATELGVRKIIPVTSKLADVRLRERADATNRLARWQRIALEAAKQCGRSVVPEVTAPLTIPEVLENRNNEIGLMFSERGGSSLEAVRVEENETASAITALVGSEGGWTDDEIEAAQAAGWHIVTLGGRVLRAETAAIVVTTLLQHVFGDLR